MLSAIGRALERAVLICKAAVDVAVLLLGISWSGASFRPAVEMKLTGERAGNRLVNVSSALERRLP